MYRAPERYGYVTCAVCDDVTAGRWVPPVCHDCLYLMSAGRMRPGCVSESVGDALAALTAYRRALGLAGPPTTAERQRWCLDYCRCRGAYLRRHNGRLPPVVPVPRIDPERWRRMTKLQRLRSHSPGTTPGPGP